MDYMKALNNYRGLADEILVEAQPDTSNETQRSKGLVQRIQAETAYDVENVASGLARNREKRTTDEMSPEDSIAAFMAAGKAEQQAREALYGEEMSTTGSMIEGAPDVFRTGGVSYGGTSDLIGLIDKTEGGGNYNTLFGHSQRTGKAFAGTNITNMTIGQLKEFTSPSGRYGQWVKQNNPSGVVATPLGRYQFVGSTMTAVADKLGLSDDTLFTPEVQDMMFASYARDRLRGKETPAARRTALRNAWEGFRNVDDATLDTAITNFMTNTSVIPQSRG